MLRFASLLCFSFFVQCLPVLAEQWEGKVIGVSDGDTITILHNTTPQRIRLAGIDCPEKSQSYGQQAKTFTSQHCFGKTVIVLEETKDRYGRTVAIITVDGKNLNEELVRAGLAWHYVKYSKDQDLSLLEAAARKGRIGLWQSEAIPPWQFRHGLKMGEQLKAPHAETQNTIEPN